MLKVYIVYSPERNQYYTGRSNWSGQIEDAKRFSRPGPAKNAASFGSKEGQVCEIMCFEATLASKEDYTTR